MGRQYMNAVFYRDENQRQLAEQSRLDEAARHNMPVTDIKTAILPINGFTYAEDYHQKYILTRYSDLRGFLNTTYPDAKSLADSTVATRLNAYLGSGLRQHANTLLEELPSYGLPADLEDSLRKLAGGA